ncbi:MAG: hypothetical protein ABI540_07265 [Spartobacteria bacterium]
MKTSPRPKITVAIGAFFIFFELVPSARGGADLPTNYLLNGERTDADQIVGPHAFLTFSTLTAFQVNLVTVTCGGSEALVPLHSPTPTSTPAV